MTAVMTATRISTRRMLWTTRSWRTRMQVSAAVARAAGARAFTMLSWAAVGTSTAGGSLAERPALEAAPHR
jgi:hypothetical protein